MSSILLSLAWACWTFLMLERVAMIYHKIHYSPDYPAVLDAVFQGADEKPGNVPKKQFLAEFILICCWSIFVFILSL